MKTKRNNPAGLQSRAPFQSDLTARTYSVRLESLDEEGRSIEAVIATENPVVVLDMARWEVIEEVLLMSGCRIPPGGQVPMLDSHDRSTVRSQLGSTQGLRIEGDKLIGRNVFSSSKEAEHAWLLTREGHLTDNSIGYRVHNGVTIEAGRTAEVAGRQFTASATRKLRIATDWESKENSVLPIGADGEAKNREQVNISTEKGKDRTMGFEQWLEQRGLKLADLDEAQRAELEKEFENEQRSNAGDGDKRQDDGSQRGSGLETDKTPAVSQTARTDAGPAVDTQKIADDAVAAERKRALDIRALGGEDVEGEVIQRCIDDGSSVEAARAVVLEAVRARRPKVNAAPGVIVHGGDIARQVLEDAMLLRAGYEETVVGDGEEGAKRAEQANRYRDMSLLEMCRYALHFDGREAPIAREDMMRAAFSTTSLPILLGNVAHKSLLRGYRDGLDTWREWCSIGSVSDFKTHTKARLTDMGDLEEVGNSGEIKHGGAEEEYEQFNIATYAKQFAITRTNIINDDLGVFTRKPMGMGRKAKLKIIKLAYTHLLANGNMQDSIALFHASHGNLNTSAALNSTNLGAAQAAFMKQTDKDGEPINILPTILLVPPDLQQTAKELLESDYIIAAGNTDVVRPSKNVAKNTMKLVVEPRLSNSNYSGYSTTTWYVSGSPNEIDTVEVSFLNGKQEPTIERFATDINVLGIGFRVYIDAGVKALDYRGMQKNTA